MTGKKIQENTLAPRRVKTVEIAFSSTCVNVRRLSEVHNVNTPLTDVQLKTQVSMVASNVPEPRLK